jgi:hypothetical protein
MITEKQLAGLDSLSRTFLPMWRTRPPARFAHESFTDRVTLTIPAKSAAVGPLVLYLDGDEITLSIGDHTHCHFSAYAAVGSASEIEREITEKAIRFVEDLLADRVVIWSRREGGHVRSGGTYFVDETGHTGRDPGSDGYLWSGRRV